MPNNLEATLFTTIKGLNDVTKVNLVQALNKSIADGSIQLDERTLHSVTSVFSQVVDASTDTYHSQMLRVVSNHTDSKPKTTKRKTSK